MSDIAFFSGGLANSLLWTIVTSFIYTVIHNFLKMFTDNASYVYALPSHSYLILLYQCWTGKPIFMSSVVDFKKYFLWLVFIYYLQASLTVFNQCHFTHGRLLFHWSI